MTFAGWVALVAGWYVTEIGRQPWLVSGVLTSAQAASAVPAAHIGFTLALYLTLYAVLIAAYVSVLFYLARKAGMAHVGVPLNMQPNRQSRPAEPIPVTGGGLPRRSLPVHSPGKGA